MGGFISWNVPVLEYVPDDKDLVTSASLYIKLSNQNKNFMQTPRNLTDPEGVILLKTE